MLHISPYIDFKGRNLIIPIIVDVTHSTGRCDLLWPIVELLLGPAHQMPIIVDFCW
ncbi:hypothetical protein [Bacillus tropicus]|uniref:hypothetical protein n=1 Tax=Bacillus tropicus TaxID=2026188 RepID=UPI00307E6E4D